MLYPYTAHEQFNVGCAYASGEVKDLMLNPYTAHEQFNVGCPVHQEK